MARLFTLGAAVLVASSRAAHIGDPPQQLGQAPEHEKSAEEINNDNFWHHLKVHGAAAQDGADARKEETAKKGTDTLHKKVATSSEKIEETAAATAEDSEDSAETKSEYESLDGKESTKAENTPKEVNTPEGAAKVDQNDEKEPADEKGKAKEVGGIEQDKTDAVADGSDDTAASAQPRKETDDEADAEVSEDEVSGAATKKSGKTGKNDKKAMTDKTEKTDKKEKVKKGVPEFCDEEEENCEKTMTATVKKLKEFAEKIPMSQIKDPVSNAIKDLGDDDTTVGCMQFSGEMVANIPGLADGLCPSQSSPVLENKEFTIRFGGRFVSKLKLSLFKAP